MEDRAEWYDIFVALVQYLLSGESNVGYLNNKGRTGRVNRIRKRPSPSTTAAGTGSVKRERDADDSAEIDLTTSRTMDQDMSDTGSKKPRAQ